MELIDLLTNTLGVNADQATGGAGLLFKLAKEKLGDTDFSQISQHVPGVNELIESAPESGGIAGALGGLASALGSSGSELGNLASLAGGFSKLELDSVMPNSRPLQFVDKTYKFTAMVPLQLRESFGELSKKKYFEAIE